MNFLYDYFCFSKLLKFICCCNGWDGDNRGTGGGGEGEGEAGGWRRQSSIGSHGKNSYSLSKSIEDENGSRSDLPQLHDLRTNYFDEEEEEEEASDEDKIIWDGQMSYQKTNNFPNMSLSRPIKCSFTEDHDNGYEN
jgi:hypothetical protein